MHLSARRREVKGHVTGGRDGGGDGGGRRWKSRDFYAVVRKCCQFRRNSRAIRTRPRNGSRFSLPRVTDCSSALISFLP